MERVEVAHRFGREQGSRVPEGGEKERAGVAPGGEVDATVQRKQRDLPPVPSPVTGEVEARLIALACSQPPAGRARWSLRLLEEHAPEPFLFSPVSGG